MRWLMRQLQQNASPSFSFSSDFAFTLLPLPPINSDALVSKTGEGKLELITRGGKVEFLFHTHSWCGSVKVQVNGTETVHDLYSADKAFKTVVVECQEGTASTICIDCGPSPSRDALGKEVWLAAVDFSSAQDWELRSIPVTELCTLTRGDVGTFITLSTDTTIGASIVQNGIWAARDVSLFKSIVQPGMTVLDIGANIGHHTVLYSSLVGPNGRVVAFEPQSIIYRALVANALLNDCANTELIQTCVGAEEGFVYLYPINYLDQTNFGALGVDPDPLSRGSAHGQKCRVAPLDALIAELDQDLTRCDFIKIDVQSFELFVLKGAARTLKRFKPKLFLEVAPYWMSKMYDYKEIYRLLMGMDYEIHHPGQDLLPGTIKEWSGRADEEWDILAIPR